MSTQLYQYVCSKCDAEVVVEEDPRGNPPLVCPDCSAVEVDYTVDPDSFKNANVTQI